MQKPAASQAGAELANNPELIGGTKVIIASLPNVDPKGLREMVDDLKNRLQEGVVLIAVPTDGKVSLIAGVSKALTSKVKAGELVNIAAQQVGGKGGGRPDMAQAGGSEPENVQAALDVARAWLTEQLS